MMTTTDSDSGNNSEPGNRNFAQMVRSLTEHEYQNLKRAIELGKWPDGTRLNREQLAHCLQLTLAYDQINLPEQQRTGFIHKGKKEGQSTSRRLAISCPSVMNFCR